MPSIQGLLVRRMIRRRTRQVTSSERSIEQMRADLDRLGERLAPPHGVETLPTQVGGCPAEWLLPRSTPPLGMVLYLHGGAYSVGSIASHRGLVGYIAAQARCRALLPEYRLAPEHPFPAALEDSLAIYRQLLARGVQPEEIVFAGDSAGGGLSLATLVALRDAGEPLPAGAVLLSAWTDLAGTGDSLRTCADKDPWLSPGPFASTAKLYHAETDPTHPLVSPLYADLSGLPPLLLQVGDHEILLSDSTRLAERAEAAGVEAHLEVWKGMWHVWQGAAHRVPESRRALRRIGQFVRYCQTQAATQKVVS